MLKAQRHTGAAFATEITKAECILKINNRNNLSNSLKSSLAFQDRKYKTIPYVVFPSSLLSLRTLCTVCNKLVLVTAAELFISPSMQKQQFQVETWDVIVPTRIPLTPSRMGVENSMQVDKVGKQVGSLKNIISVATVYG